MPDDKELRDLVMTTAATLQAHLKQCEERYKESAESRDRLAKAVSDLQGEIRENTLALHGRISGFRKFILSLIFSIGLTVIGALSAALAWAMVKLWGLA